MFRSGAGKFEIWPGFLSAASPPPRHVSWQHYRAPRGATAIKTSCTCRLGVPAPVEMGLHVGRRIVSPRSLSGGVAADTWSASVRQSRTRGIGVDFSRTGKRGLMMSDSVHPSRSRHSFASTPYARSTNSARKRGLELVGAKGSYSPFHTLRTSKCAPVQVGSRPARVQVHLEQHQYRRLSGSRDGFGGGQHFPHSDQVWQEL